MRKVRFVAPAAISALVLALAFSSPAAAFALIKQTGQTGDYGVKSGVPEAWCSYSAPGAGVHLKSIKVHPLAAGPATGNSQKVTLTFALQRSTDNGTSWRTIKTSSTQTGTATTTSNPGFKAVTFTFTSKPTAFYRATATLKWLTSGAQSGLLKMRLTDYGVKVGQAINSVDASDYCAGQLFD